jgi:hypothetical protein
MKQCENQQRRHSDTTAERSAFARGMIVGIAWTVVIVASVVLSL